MNTNNNVKGTISYTNTNSPGNSVKSTNLSKSLLQTVKNEFDIRSLNPGQIFQGRIVDIRNDMITIDVNHQTLHAKFDHNVNITMGETLNFLVKENNENQVLIKPLTMEGFTPKDNTIYKAIDAAGLLPTNKNFDAVNALFEHQMPLDKQTISTLLMNATLHADTGMDQLVLMMKYHLELNDTNITQFKNYVNSEHQLSNELNRLLQMIPETLDQMAESGQVKDSMDFLSHILGKDKIHENPMLSKLFDLSLENEDSFRNLLKSSSMMDAVTEAFTKQFSVKPEELNNGKLKELYQNISEKLGNLNDTILTTDGRQKDMMQTASELKDNLQFMKNLNDSFIYTQLPLNLQNKIKHSDLYVYADKRKKGNRKEGVSVLLHLDMDYLGSTDVFVKLKDNKINAKFSMPDESSVKLMEEHMEQLINSLHQKGFVFLPEVVQKSAGEEIDFTKNFLEKDAAKIEVTRYSFDIRA